MTISASVSLGFPSMRPLTMAAAITALVILTTLGAQAADTATLIAERSARIVALERKLKEVASDQEFATQKLAQLTTEQEQVYAQIGKQEAALNSAQAALVAERHKTAAVVQQAQNTKNTQWRNREEIDALMEQNLTLTATVEATLTELYKTREAAKPKPGK